MSDIHALTPAITFLLVGIQFNHSDPFKVWTASHELEAEEKGDVLSELGIKFKGIERKD